MTTIDLDQLAHVSGGQTERQLYERFKKELPKGSSQHQRFIECLDANPPNKDVDNTKWRDVLPIFLKCSREALKAT